MDLQAATTHPPTQPTEGVARLGARALAAEDPGGEGVEIAHLLLLAKVVVVATTNDQGNNNNSSSIRTSHAFTISSGTP